jgi:hypothetical protein
VDGVVFEESGLQRYDTAILQAITNVSVSLVEMVAAEFSATLFSRL